MTTSRSNAYTRTLEEGLGILARVIAVSHLKKYNRNLIGVQFKKEDIKDGGQREKTKSKKNTERKKPCK